MPEGAPPPPGGSPETPGNLSALPGPSGSPPPPRPPPRPPPGPGAVGMEFLGEGAYGKLSPREQAELRRFLAVSLVGGIAPAGRGRSDRIVIVALVVIFALFAALLVAWMFSRMEQDRREHLGPGGRPILRPVPPSPPAPPVPPAPPSRPAAPPAPPPVSVGQAFMPADPGPGQAGMPVLPTSAAPAAPARPPSPSPVVPTKPFPWD